MTATLTVTVTVWAASDPAVPRPTSPADGPKQQATADAIAAIDTTVNGPLTTRLAEAAQPGLDATAQVRAEQVRLNPEADTDPPEGTRTPS